MVQDGLGFAFILGAGALLLRPRDFPLFARAAGRIVGLTVRTMRATKDAAETAVKESADMTHRQNPEMIVMRENLKRSMDKFESLATTVRRDIADVPLNPSLLLRKGWRSLENVAKDPVRPETDFNRYGNHKGTNTPIAVPQNVQTRGGSLPASGNVSHLHKRPRDAVRGEIKGQITSGADLMTRAIEEAALARQEQYIFGKTKK